MATRKTKAKTAKKTTAAKKKTTRSTTKAAAKKPAAKRATATKKVAPKKAATTARSTPKPSAAKPKQSAALFSFETPQFNGFDQSFFDPKNFQNYQPQSMEDMMSKNKKQMDQFAQDAADMSRESIEAFVKSGTIFAKGFEDLMRTSVGLAQTAAEKQAQFAKEAMSTKSIHEFTETQTRIAQASYEDFVSTSTKISEMGVKLLTDACEPLNEQLNKTIQKTSEAMAA